MRVRDIMTTAVVTVAPEDSVTEVAETLAALGFSALPVVDGTGALRGIVTEADLIDNRYPLGSTRTPPAEPTELKRTVAEVMTDAVVAISHDADTALLARLMISDHLRSVPVIDGGRLVGIATRRDMLRTLSRSDSDIAADIRRNLDTLGGTKRWSVQVSDGEAVLHDDFITASDRSVAQALAEAVSGVTRVTVTARQPTHTEMAAPSRPT